MNSNQPTDARNKLAFSLNSQILELYWEIGKEIAEKQQRSVWGSSLVETVAKELHIEFPEIKGFSRRNVYVMVQWYKFYSAKYPLCHNTWHKFRGGTIA